MDSVNQIIAVIHCLKLAPSIEQLTGPRVSFPILLPTSRLIMGGRKVSKIVFPFLTCGRAGSRSSQSGLLSSEWGLWYLNRHIICLCGAHNGWLLHMSIDLD